METIGVLGLVFYCWVNYRELQVFDSERIVMIRDGVLDQRAWVAPFEMTVGGVGADTNFNYFILKFKNTGKTPALNASENHDFVFGVESVPTNDPEIKPASLMLAPDGVCWFRVGPFDADTFAAIAKGHSVPVCVYGKFAYDDIFGNHHWTRFCWSVEAGLNCRPVGAHNSCDDAQETGGK